MKQSKMKEMWTGLFPGVPPLHNAQWDLWGAIHEPSIIRRGIIAAAVKNRKLGGAMSTEWTVKFASSVMNRLSKETAEAPERTGKENPHVEVNFNR